MKRSVAALGLTLILAATLPAQSPAVQQLYQKAHADQEAGHPEQAVADYRELLRLDPSIAAAYNNLGRLLYNLDRFPEAITVLSKGLSLQPDMAPASVMLGASYLQSGAAAKAVAPLQAGIAAMPDDKFARQTLARTFISLGRRDDAVTELQTLLQHDPKDQQSWYLLGKLQLEQSQASFARIREIDPNSPLSHQISAEIMESMKNTPGAIAEYKQVLILSPGDPEALSHLANVYWSTGDWTAARPLFVTYLQKKPADCLVHWKLANTLAELEATPDAILHETALALQLCPDLPQARVERARALLKQGDAKQALPELKAAETKAPDEPSIQFLLARAYKALGDPAAATAASTRFAELQKAEHDAAEKHAADVITANQ